MEHIMYLWMDKPDNPFTVTLFTPPKSPPETWYPIQNFCLCANLAKISHQGVLLVPRYTKMSWEHPR